jgi:hypothetical protein
VDQVDQGRSRLAAPATIRQGALLYRALLALGGFVLYRVCAIKVEIEGRENLPDGGGFILAAALHRGWIDPLIPLNALPIEPRIWFLGTRQRRSTSRGRSAFFAKPAASCPSGAAAR